MPIRGNIVCKNAQAKLAAADIGWGEAIVVELAESSDVHVGDTITGLCRGYAIAPCYNESRAKVLTVTVLSGGLPVDAACSIVNCEMPAPTPA